MESKKETQYKICETCGKEKKPKGWHRCKCKACPKCGTIHSKRGRFCSSKCAMAREWTEEQKRDKARAKRKSMYDGTDKTDEERWRINRNKRIPPDIPKDETRLEHNQFIANGMIWTEVD